MSVSSHQSVGAVSLSLVVKVNALFLWKMEVNDPAVFIARVEVTSSTQTEEQVDAGSNVSKNAS